MPSSDPIVELVTDSPLFQTHTDQESGVVSYVLTHRVAPVQQGFYFVNSGWSDDGRYLWLYCAFPPSPGHSLAVIDFQQQAVTHCPETAFNHASPMVLPGSGEILWTSGAGLWRRSPEPGQPAEMLNRIPADWIGQRGVGRGATHLTRSPDGREVFIDAAVGYQAWFGTMPLDGGEFQLWHRFDRNYNHAQFSPVDGDLALFAQEHHSDPLTGLRFNITDRMWVIRRGQPPRPIFPEPTVLTHEWWHPSGQKVWCIRGFGDEQGTWLVDLDSAAYENVWPAEQPWHSHDHPAGPYLTGDRTVKGFYRGCPSTVHFFNRDTGREVRIAANPERKDYAAVNYHIDPHPRFCCGGRFVVHTTTVRGEVDLAVTPIEPLIDRTT